jgi:hypothetical protein
LANFPQNFAGLIFGPPIFVAGVATWRITRFGKVWWGLNSMDKLKIMPGLVIGAFFGLIFLFVIPIIYAIFKLIDLREY